MDRKEAIERIQEVMTIIRTQHMCKDMDGECTTEDRETYIQRFEALRMAIEALQEPQVGGVDKDFETILLCAVRYAIGRQTYIPSRVIDYITPLLPYLSEDVLKLIADEIIGHYTYEGALGDEKIDRPYWEQFLRKIRLEIGDRNEK